MFDDGNDVDVGFAEKKRKKENRNEKEKYVFGLVALAMF